MTRQRARDQQARAIAKSWRLQMLDREQVLARLSKYANDPEHLHLTPHLVTAVTEVGLLHRRAHA